ncbi:MAG: hypothetical protein WAT22_14330 [Saprospiraceae bacterium]
MQQRPDIIVVQECEHPDKLIFNPTTQPPNDMLWFGDNNHKGLGIFSYSNYRFQLLSQHNAGIKIVAPISVTGGKLDFTLFAIWANNRTDPDGQYIEQVWNAVNHYRLRNRTKSGLLQFISKIILRYILRKVPKCGIFRKNILTWLLIVITNV